MDTRWQHGRSLRQRPRCPTGGMSGSKRANRLPRRCKSARERQPDIVKYIIVVLSLGKRTAKRKKSPSRTRLVHTQTHTNAFFSQDGRVRQEGDFFPRIGVRLASGT